MIRLLGAQLATQETRLFAATSEIIGERVGTLCSEIAQQRNVRSEDVQRLESRLSALKSHLAACDQLSDVDKILNVVGGYGKLAQAAACDIVRTGLAGEASVGLVGSNDPVCKQTWCSNKIRYLMYVTNSLKHNCS